MKDLLVELNQWRQSLLLENEKYIVINTNKTKEFNEEYQNLV